MWQTASPRPSSLGFLSLALRRLLRSLVSLKQVITNAAHYLVLGDKEAYEFDPGTPFLQMVSPYYILKDPVVGVGTTSRAAIGGCCASFASLALRYKSHVYGTYPEQVGVGRRPSPVIIPSSCSRLCRTRAVQVTMPCQSAQ